MKIYKVKDYEQLSKKAANIIASVVTLKPDCVLGLATGSSPVGTYAELVKMYKAGDLDFSQVTTVNLDEYKGMDGTNEQSYRYFMNYHLFSKVNIPLENTHVPDGTVEDTEAGCKAYNEILHQAGPADLQLLGIGHDGHIGFNEPGDYFPKETHCMKLAEETIQANKRFFQSEEDVPRYAYTMGIGTIMSAKTILLVASGTDKAEALARAINGPITPALPGSILQLHPNCIVVADEAALSKTQL